MRMLVSTQKLWVSTSVGAEQPGAPASWGQHLSCSGPMSITFYFPKLNKQHLLKPPSCHTAEEGKVYFATTCCTSVLLFNYVFPGKTFFTFNRKTTQHGTWLAPKHAPPLQTPKMYNQDLQLRWPVLRDKIWTDKFSEFKKSHLTWAWTSQHHS